MTSFLRVGVIVKPHGLKGQAKVFATTDDPRRFGRLKRVYAGPRAKALSYGEHAQESVPAGTRADNREISADATKEELYIDKVSYFKNMVIVKFRGIDTRDAIERYRGIQLYIPREEGEPLGEGEHYIADIMDMEVISDEEVHLGRIKDVIETGANDVYVVQRSDGARDLLLPAIDECILSVDIERNQMKVHVMDGLMAL